MSTIPEKTTPPFTALGTLRWMRANITLPNGLEEHIDALLNSYDDAVLAALKSALPKDSAP